MHEPDIAEKLKQTTNVLDLCDGGLGDRGVINLALELKESTITRLDLRNNSITFRGGEALAKLMQDNENIIDLDIGNNFIGPDGADMFVRVLRKHANITNLNFGYNELRDTGARHVGELLKASRSLETFNVRGNDISAYGCQFITGALSSNRTSTLQFLNLYWNNIGDEGAAMVGDMLSRNDMLTSLNIGYNNIGDDGSVHLATGLMHNTTLQSLDLNSNVIGDKGMESLCGVLKTNTTLEELKLDCNKLTTTSAFALIDVIKVNAHLVHLTVRHNEGIDPDSERQLKKVVTQQRHRPEPGEEEERVEVESSFTGFIGAARSLHIPSDHHFFHIRTTRSPSPHSVMSVIHLSSKEARKPHVLRPLGPPDVERNFPPVPPFQQRLRRWALTPEPGRTEEAHHVKHQYPPRAASVPPGADARPPSVSLAASPSVSRELNRSLGASGSLHPQSGSRMSPQAGSRMSPQAGSRMSPQSGSRMSPLSGTQMSPLSGTRPRGRLKSLVADPLGPSLSNAPPLPDVKSLTFAALDASARPPTGEGAKGVWIGGSSSDDESGPPRVKDLSRSPAAPISAVPKTVGRPAVGATPTGAQSNYSPF